MNIFAPSSHTYYTCEIKSNTWICQKGFMGEHVFQVPKGRDPHQYLKKALAFELVIK